MSEHTEKPKESKPELKPCFIITPIGEPGLETYTKAMGLINSVIRPILSEFGYDAIPANKIDAAGSINKQIIQHLVNDELVIANVTGFNPNVMYELAIRHSYQRKVIIMAEKGPNLPFDIFDQRTIFYQDTLHGVEDAVTQLRKMLQEVISTEVTSNPIMDAVKDAAVVNNQPAGEIGDTLKFILEKLETLESSSIVKTKNPINPNDLLKSFLSPLNPLKVKLAPNKAAEYLMSLIATRMEPRDIILEMEKSYDEESINYAIFFVMKSENYSDTALRRLFDERRAADMARLEVK